MDATRKRGEKRGEGQLVSSDPSHRKEKKEGKAFWMARSVPKREMKWAKKKKLNSFALSLTPHSPKTTKRRLYHNTTEGEPGGGEGNNKRGVNSTINPAPVKERKRLERNAGIRGRDEMGKTQDPFRIYHLP